MKSETFWGMLVVSLIVIGACFEITGDSTCKNPEIEDIQLNNDNNLESFIIEYNLKSRSAETIIINEFMPDPASDWDGDLVYNSQDDEWVELFNYGTQSVDISGWNISDYFNKRYAFSPGVVIPPGGYYVAFGSNQSFALTNSGDTIKLLNSTDVVVDNFTYDVSFDDISYGRLPDAGNDWTEFNEPTPGRSNGGKPKIVINEVMYNPAGSDSENEWLELFNNDTRTINITSWRLSDQDGLVDYIFKTGDYPFMLFPPQTYLVVHSGNGEDEMDFSDGNGHLYMSLTTAMLNNDGDDILFSDRGFFCIDYIAYGESTMIDPPPNPSAWDGTWYDSGGDVYIKDKPNPVADHDCTIQLINNGQDDNTVLDWGNASGPEITQGRNNNEIIGLEVACENNVNYLNTGEEAIFNISILNTGNIQLNLEINTTEVPKWWGVHLGDTKIIVPKKAKTNITITVIAPDNITSGNELHFNVSFYDIGLNLSETIQISAIIPSVDLTLSYLQIDGSTYISDISEGDIVQLKSKVVNLGIKDGAEFSVGFYYNETDPDHLLEIKNYDYIFAGGYKYPSIYWDTLGFSGNYTLIVLVDPENRIIEPDENNNRLEVPVYIENTSPLELEKHILITEVYYDSKLSYDPDEFIRIYNPTNIDINITGWQLTDEPKRDYDETIAIPDNSWLGPKQSVYITNDAEAFKSELGSEPDFACDPGSLKNVKLLGNPTRWPVLANYGDLVILRDEHRHIIDTMCYGEADSSLLDNHWHGDPVPSVQEGKILKRQREVNAQNNNIIKYLDSDSAFDWRAPRLYGIGQSDFYPQTFDFTGKVIPFISPENSLSTIISEVKNASKYINLNIYEFSHPILAESLSEALGRGVSVRILLEGNPVGWNFSNVNDPETEKNYEYSQKYILYQLHQAGAQIKFLSNIKNDNKNSNIFKRYNYNHAKYALIDGEKCIIMSGNWKPASVPIDISFGNREWGVVIYNSEVAYYFNAVFEADWWPSSEIQNDTHYFDLDSEVYGAPPDFFELNFTVPIGWYEPIEPLATNAPLQPIQDSFKIEPVISPDTAGRPDSAIIGLINKAKSSVYIQQMDCNLDWVLTRTSSKKLSINWSDSENYYLNWVDGNHYYNEYLRAIIDAARRGCDVKILLDSRYVESDMGPGKVYEGSIEDNLDTIQYINHLASLEGLTDNLEARLNYLYGLEMVHNKGIVVDGQKVLISSINWNYNSVSNNREAGVIIDNAQVAEFYAEVFNQDWSRSIEINNPKPLNTSEAAILITEVYANTYLNYEPDEYIAITNPTNDTVDISGWSISDKLTTYGGYEGYLVFPMGSIIKSQEKLYITRTGQAFYDVHNFLPDFEFFEDSRSDVPQMEIIDSSSSTNRGPRFANKGDEVVLADEYLFSDFGLEFQHVIDMVIYGNSTYISDFNNISYPYNTTHWYGPSIYNISQGEVLKRNRIEYPIVQKRKFTEFYDSNSATDWETNRVYYPGQSEFQSNIIDYTGSLTVFSSPDSSYQTISDELDKAKISIYMSIYQFHNPYLMDKLVNASLRGVNVKVLLDGAPVGGITDAARFVAQELVKSDCEVRYLRSVAVEDIYRRYRFIHAKYTVIDDFTTIIISENWKTTGVPVDNTAGNRGWGVVLRNFEVAHSYSQVFFHDWNPGMKDSYAFNSSDPKYGAPPEDFVMSWAVFGGNYRPRFDSKTINGAFKVIPVIAPDTTLNNYGTIIEMINSAKTSVYIEQMDCNIDWDTKGRDIENLYLTAAIDAARRGCEVKILLGSAFTNPSDPGLDNYDTVQYINSIAYNENLTDNLQAKLIYLDGTAGKNVMAIVHNKGLIVDGTKTLVSSINWVTGSVIYNREVGVIIENEKVTQFFTEIFNYDWNLTVQELIEVYVLHSDTHDILPGETTEYIINFVNMQINELHVNLSLTGLLPGWNATLDTYNFVLSPIAHNISEPMEVRLSVTAPTQDYLEALKNSSNPNSKYALLSTQELGIHAKVSGMVADIVFTTTNLMDESEADNGGSPNADQPLDRSMVNPWLVVILLVILLISGAILRDVVHSRLEKKRKSSKTNGETEAEDFKEENQKEIESDHDETAE